MTLTPTPTPSRDRPLAGTRTFHGLTVLLALAWCLIDTTVISAQGAGSATVAIPTSQIFTFLFLMLGPIKIIGPYVKVTKTADAALAHRLAFRATFYASIALLLAAVVGQSFLERYSIPVPVLTLAGGLILFLVALQGILEQFQPPTPQAAEPAPALKMAMTPLAFPTIVTPHGIAALTVFMSLSPDLNGKLTVGGLVMAIMALNLVAMLAARHILRFLGVFLQILGSVLGIIQVALGLEIMLSSLKTIWG